MNRNQFGLYYTYLPCILPPNVVVPLDKQSRRKLVKKIRNSSDEIHEMIFMFIMEHAVRSGVYIHPSEILPFGMKVKSNDTVLLNVRSLSDDLLCILYKFIMRDENKC